MRILFDFLLLSVIFNMYEASKDLSDNGDRNQ